MLASGWTADPGRAAAADPPVAAPGRSCAEADLGPVAEAITRYHAGELSAIDDVPVRQRSGAFLEHAWEVLRTVPAGAPVTYTRVRGQVRPTGGRAGGRVGLRPQRRRPVRTLPPGAAHRRHPRRVPLGLESSAARPRGRQLTVRSHRKHTAPATDHAVRVPVGRGDARPSVRPFGDPIAAPRPGAPARSCRSPGAPWSTWTPPPCRRCSSASSWARCWAPARPGSWCPPGPGCTPPRPPGPPPTPRRWPAPTRPGCAPNGPACWSGSTSSPSSTTGRWQRLRRAESEAAAAQAALSSEREAGARREQLLLRRDAELKQAFQALSADALARNNEQFVALAEGRIKEATAALHAKASGDEAARAHAIAQLLDPMASTLQRVEGQLRTVEKEREAAYAGLREQVSAMRSSSEQLRGETKQLVNALRAPQVRGRWGELQLERIVQLAGMVEHCDFSTQVTGAGRAGRGATGHGGPAGRRQADRGRRQGAVRGLPGGGGDHRPGRAPRAAGRARPPAAPARRRAERQELLGRVRAVARVRGAVRARRPVPGGRAAGRPGAARARVRPATSWWPRRPR